MNSPENRRYRRLEISLDLRCRRVNCLSDRSYAGCTINASPGGLYFETQDHAFKPGDLIRVEMLIRPTAGVLESGGGISAFAKVLRTDDLRADTKLPYGRYGVALQFCHPPRLCT